MEELRQAIRQWGRGIGSDVVKVDSFINHRIDVGLLNRMGQALADHFRGDKPDVILTVEASGIALAVTTAQALGNLPVIFAKKHEAATQRGTMLRETVHSYTHGNEYDMRVSADLLTPGTRVLIVDDFLADGESVRGMTSLIRQAGATLVGVGVAIEKGFQHGGRLLREKGVKLLSLSVVTSIRDGQVMLEDDR